MVNNATEQLLSYSREDFLRMNLLDIHPLLEKDAWTDLWKNIKKNREYSFETLLRNKSGRNIPVEINAALFMFNDFEMCAYSARDISERKKAEEEIKKQNHLLYSTINSISHPFFVIDAKDYSVVMANDAAGFDLGRGDNKCYSLSHNRKHPCSHKDHPCPLHTVRASGEPHSVEHIHTNAEGEKVYVEVHAYPISDEAGNVVKIIEYAVDISERKKAETDLKTAYFEIEKLKDRLQKENIYLRQEIKSTYNFEEIISNSKSFRQVLNNVEKVASTASTVLILGETGTGKELLARAIHNLSPRRDRFLVKVNCAALPASLIESELFGHEKGAFTGALTKKIGRFELADKGTIFLDEIGELPLELQTKLLRVLQEGEFERLGNSSTMKVDVRVIAATNRDLENAILKKEFREDLYYRINVFPLVVPPLRERRDDIPILINHFIQKYSKKIGKKIDAVAEDAMETLMNYHWPGNIRELENVIERSIIISNSKIIENGDWLPGRTMPDSSLYLNTLDEIEKQHIIKTLEHTGWRVSGNKGAAKILDLKPTTLEARMKKLGIVRNK
jgi:formate hydrogenlyase transcriptional activator